MICTGRQEGEQPSDNIQKNIYVMKVKYITAGIIIMAQALCSCGNKGGGRDVDFGVVEYYTNAPGDSTIYGLACDGCTDSVVVVLPYAGGDPDTFDIIAAARNRRIYGEPHIGNRMALTVNPRDRREARQVIVIDDLERQWCFKVMPEITGTVDDSTRQKLMVAREYSYTLKRDNQMRTAGDTPQTGTSDEQSPAEYPEIRQYNKWSILNGKLVLAFDMQNVIANDSLHAAEGNTADTAEIVMLTPDSLVLRIKDKVRGFYRRGS